ncbi:MAG TPA: Tm-1-like ATP-binding domain-containing protein [Chthonomonadaceae bacterium]|nr:Tm-1-like ATP-binding domain-containing protein [Chthonomonadaceae bacterium]
MDEKVVAVLGTLDTKGVEAAYLKECVRRAGQPALLIDTGVLAEALVPADVAREAVAQAGGTSLKALREAGDRGQAVVAMGRGAAVLLANLHRAGRLVGVVGLGGSAGTSIAATAMQALPVGLPKLIVSTMASGDTRAYVGVKDVTLMYSVVDIAGLNRFSREVLGNAAAAIVGMAARYAGREAASSEEKPLIAATMFGVTTPCVTCAREYLESRGYEVLVFHATGTGGRAMEGLVADGFIDGVLDVTTTEWADELVGGILSAGPHRLEAIGRRGIPHVVAPGALDMVNFGPRDTVPAQFASRLLYQHNPQVTLMRTTVEENRQLGQILGQKLNLAPEQVEVFLPLGGVSAIDREGQPFYDPAADAAFRDSLRATLNPAIPIHEMPAHINDEAFALAMARRLEEMVQQRREGQAVASQPSMREAHHRA